MEHYLDHVGMVRWQGRRLAAENRAKSRLVRLALLFAALSVASLTIGFYSGLPVPLDLLQTLVVLLVGAGLVFVARAGLDVLVHRDERTLGRRR
jgi:hypothetical protein